MKLKGDGTSVAQSTNPDCHLQLPSLKVRVEFQSISTTPKGSSPRALVFLPNSSPTSLWLNLLQDDTWAKQQLKLGTTVYALGLILISCMLHNSVPRNTREGD